MIFRFVRINTPFKMLTYPPTLITIDKQLTIRDMLTARYARINTLLNMLTYPPTLSIGDLLCIDRTVCPPINTLLKMLTCPPTLITIEKQLTI